MHGDSENSLPSFTIVIIKYTVIVKIYCDSEIHSEGQSEIHYHSVSHSASHSALHSEFSLSPCSRSEFLNI